MCARDIISQKETAVTFTRDLPDITDFLARKI